MPENGQGGMITRDTRWQLFRFALVGLGSNAVLYLLYLLLTGLGLGHKTAMTLLYILGVLQTFVFNRHWTFRHQGKMPKALRRYLASYGFGYCFNLGMLLIMVDRLGLSHQIVQGILILITAGLLFLLQKYWVFPDPTELSLAQSPR